MTPGKPVPESCRKYPAGNLLFSDPGNCMTCKDRQVNTLLA